MIKSKRLLAFTIAVLIAAGLVVHCAGCAETTAAVGVVHTVAQGTCLVCRKLEDLGVCEHDQPCATCADAGAPTGAEGE